MSILVEIATEIADALTAHAFAYGDFTATWDFENRTKDKSLQSESLDVRVIVPRKVEEATRHVRSKLRYCAGFDIDVRFKFGVTSQDPAPEIPKAKLTDLLTLTEDIHQFFLSNDVLGDNSDLQWIASDDDLGVESKILVAYSTHWIRETGMYYGCCREFFRKVQ